MPKLKVAFRLDAGSTTGVSMGHAFRCIALLKALKKHRAITAEAFGSFNSTAKTLLRQNDITVNDHSRPDQTFEKHHSDLKVVDLSDLILPHYKPPPQAGSVVALIDDYGLFKGDANLVVSAFCPLSNQHYRATGLNLAILGANPPSRDALMNKQASRLLVSFGGSDPSGLTIETTEALSPDVLGLTTVCVGPSYETYEELWNLVASKAPTALVKKGVPSLTDEMAQAALVITAGGLSALEAAASGTPSVLIPSRSGETVIPQMLAAESCSIILERQKISELTNLVSQLINTPQTLAKMGENGAQLVDFKGADRVASLLMDTLQKTTNRWETPE